MTRNILSLLTVTSLLNAAEPPPLLFQNGDFSAKSLKPWECDEGKKSVDPQNPKNPALLVTLDGGVFALTQDLPQPLPHSFPSHLSLRAFTSSATKDHPIQLRFRWVDAEGNSEIFATFTLTSSAKWIPIKVPCPKPQGHATSILIESNRGEGKLWLDDLKDEQADVSNEK